MSPFALSTPSLIAIYLTSRSTKKISVNGKYFSINFGNYFSIITGILFSIVLIINPYFFVVTCIFCLISQLYTGNEPTLYRFSIQLSQGNDQ